MIRVKVLKGRGSVLPIKGKVRHYGYHARGAIIEILEDDFDERYFQRVDESAPITEKPKKKSKLEYPEEPVEIVGDDFTILTGIGKVAQKKLNEAGVLTYGQLVEYGTEGLNDLLGFDDDKAFTVLQEAIEHG